MLIRQRGGRRIQACLLLFIAFSAQAGSGDGAAIVYVGLTALSGVSGRIVDTRPLAACREASLPGARCLPVEELLAPNHRLPNFSGLLWLLGTAGLSGDEELLVVGDKADRRDFAAGLLYLAGQRQISVLNVRLSGREAATRGRGMPRSRIRESVYRAPMRHDRLILRGELQRMISSKAPPVLLDGRSEEEYWGVRVRAARGGHIPGAQHLDSASLKRAAGSEPAYPDSALVAYAQDAYDGLAYLARLVARGIEAALYMDGWRDWASDGRLPVDSQSFPDHWIAGKGKSP